MTAINKLCCRVSLHTMLRPRFRGGTRSVVFSTMSRLLSFVKLPITACAAESAGLPTTATAQTLKG